MEYEPIFLDYAHYLATDADGDYTLSRVPSEKFRGKRITAKRCNDIYGRYVKIDRGDKIHLVGVGVMAEVEGKYVDDGEYWVADYVMGMDISEFVRKFGDKIFRTSILVFEMSKDLVEGWNGLSDVERNKAKDSIIQDTASKTFFLGWEDNCKRFKLDKAVLDQVFDDMLADMFDDDAHADSDSDSDFYSEGNMSQEIEALEEGIADM
ncbi:hypothetical protein OROMI_007240 [Orobanche minor]